MSKTIKIEGVEIPEEKVTELVKKHAPELLSKSLDMVVYYNVLLMAVNYHDKNHLDPFPKGCKARLQAYLNIWKWKQEHDGDFGIDKMMGNNISKWSINYSHPNNLLEVMNWCFFLECPELPIFSSREIAEQALKELEQEYKIVFNVK